MFEKIKLVAIEKYEVEPKNISILIAILPILDYQRSKKVNKINLLKNELCQEKNEKLRADTLKQEVRSKVIKRFQLEDQKNAKTCGSSFAVSNIEFSLLGTRTLSFILKKKFRSKKALIESLMKEKYSVISDGGR